MDTLPARQSFTPAVDRTSAALLTDRRPADAGFIARKVLSIAWDKFGVEVPPAHSRTWLIEACRAELSWSVADYCRITGTSSLAHDSQYDGPHPSQSWRLPVENLAARVLNAWGHVHVETRNLRHALTGLRAARRAASNEVQNSLYRVSWARTAALMVDEIRQLLAYRRRAWPVFVAAAREYRAVRAEIDAEAMRRAA